MAEQHDPQKVAAILQDYTETLEVLTINSKPLINDLTMAADRYKPLAFQIIEKIESRLFEVSAAFTFVFIDLCVFLCLYLLCFLYNFTDLWEMAMNKGTISQRVCRFKAFSTLYHVMRKMNFTKKKGVNRELVTGSPSLVPVGAS